MDDLYHIEIFVTTEISHGTQLIPKKDPSNIHDKRPIYLMFNGDVVGYVLI